MDLEEGGVLHRSLGLVCIGVHRTHSIPTPANFFDWRRRASFVQCEVLGRLAIAIEVQDKERELKMPAF
jgi:hypothetical protein